MMNETIKKEVNVIGTVKVELFDAKSNKKVYEEEGNNYISDMGKEAFLAGQQLALGGGSNAYVRFSNYMFPYNTYVQKDVPSFFRYMQLTDDSQIESPETEVKALGNRLARVDLSEAYSGTDPAIGTINESESIPEINKIKFVCDFGTDKANGTFQSIYLTHTTASPATDRGYIKINNLGLFKHVVSGQVTAMTADATHYYVFYSSQLHRINKETGESESLGSMTITPNSCHHFNGYIYCGDDQTGGDYSYLWRYNISSGSFEKASTTWSGSERCLGIIDDGTYVYIYGASSTSGGSCQIHQIDPVTFDRISSKYAPGQLTYNSTSWKMMKYDGSWFFMYPTTSPGYNGRYDYSTNTFTEDTQFLDSWISSYQEYVGYADDTLFFNHREYRKTGTIYLMVTPYNLDAMRGGYTFMTRKRLSTPITKTNDQAMKITYTFTFV